MLQIEGRNREALEVFDRTRARLGSTNPRAALTLEGAALGAAQLDIETAKDAAKLIAGLRRLAEERRSLSGRPPARLTLARARALVLPRRCPSPHR